MTDGGVTGDSDGSAPCSPPLDDPSSAIELHAEVVEYPDSPDRVTVYPPGLTGVDRMSAWLSADRSLLVDLDEFR